MQLHHACSCTSPSTILSRSFEKGFREGIFQREGRGEEETMVTLQQLNYFCTLAKFLHYTKAAEALHITQPTLSYAISELQRELGVPLFEKRDNRTVLTHFGEAFLPHASRSLEAIEEGQRVVANMSLPESTTINLGYIYSVSFDFLPRIVNSFQHKKENASVIFRFFQGTKNQILEKLNSGDIELAFSSDYSGNAIRSTPLFTQELFLVVPTGHSLTLLKDISLEDIRNEPFIIAPHGSGLRVFVDDIFRAAGMVPNIVFEAEECNAMAAFVNSRQGVAIMPKIPLLDTYNVSVLKITSPPLVRDISLLWKEGRTLPSIAQRFRDFVTGSDLSGYCAAS
jgi:DNA-binding transcriptional LysR family regulator